MSRCLLRETSQIFRPESSVDVLSTALGSNFCCLVNAFQNGRLLSGCPLEMNNRPYLLVGREECFPKVSVLYWLIKLISPAVLPPAWRSNNVVRHISRICLNLHIRNARPRGIVTNPLQSLYARKQLHPLVAAFRTAEINNLLIITSDAQDTEQLQRSQNSLRDCGSRNRPCRCGLRVGGAASYSSLYAQPSKRGKSPLWRLKLTNPSDHKAKIFGVLITKGLRREFQRLF